MWSIKTQCCAISKSLEKPQSEFPPKCARSCSILFAGWQASRVYLERRETRKVVMPGAGHVINMECPAEFNRIVLDFLEQLDREEKT